MDYVLPSFGLPSAQIAGSLSHYARITPSVHLQFALEDSLEIRQS